MATKTFYMVGGSVAGSSFRTISETAQTPATLTDGWVVGTGAANHSEYTPNFERASSTFSTAAAPDGTIDGSSMFDAFRSENAVNGSFAAGNWTFNFAVRAVTSAGSQNGRIRFRVFIANGDSDPMILPRYSYLLAGLIPGARLKIYPDAAHGFLFQHHAEFAAEIDAFLAST